MYHHVSDSQCNWHMLVPPMVVFKYERIPANIANLMPVGWGIGKSESGWMTGETFFEYVSNIMFNWILANNIPLPVVLFVDGHTSHLTLKLISSVNQNNNRGYHWFVITVNVMSNRD